MIQYFRNLMQYILLIAVITLVTTVAMYFAVISNFTPSYESNTALLVSRYPDALDEYEAYVMLQEVQIASRIVNDIPELVFSTRVKHAVNQALAQEQPAVSFYDMITFRSNVETEIIRDTRVVNVTVRHTDPEVARLVAETIALTIDQLMMEIEGQNFIHVIRTAEKSDHPVGLAVEHLWALSVLGGILLGMGLILILTLSERDPVSPIELNIFGIFDIRSYLKRIRRKEDN